MKLLDNTNGLSRTQISSIKYALMFMKFTEKEQSLDVEGYVVDYWLHTIPNVHDDKIKVVRVSCMLLP